MKIITISFSAVFLLPVVLSAQLSNTGIKWTSGLSLDQVKQRAKQENKYIFLDVFATWCGPCKEMDKYVYGNDTVGSFFNDQFISVKVQTDQTKSDDEEVKKWYGDAQSVSKQYRVLSLPTFIFLAPNGNVVHKVTGFHTVNRFIEEATIALQPGQAYVDPYNDYDKLEENYNQNRKDYNRMLYMIRSARELGKTDFEKVLIQDYCKYLERANNQQLYIKENIEFLNEVEIKSDSKLFSIFYPNGTKADKAVGKKGFSTRIVNRVVYREIVEPFLQLKPGQMIIRMDGKAVGKQDFAEADWAALYNRIATKYPKEYAKRGVLNGKLTWYEQKENFLAYYTVYLEKLDTYGFDKLGVGNTSYPSVNANCWFLFLRIEDKALLNRAANWMEKLIAIHPDPAWIDTYANLLYKSGDKERAISWEEKALAIVIEKQWQSDIDQFSQTLSKMRRNETTW